MESHKHIVNFNKYCESCLNKDCSEWNPDSPCYECLKYSYNYDTDKPQLWEENTKKSTSQKKHRP